MGNAGAKRGLPCGGAPHEDVSEKPAEAEYCLNLGRKMRCDAAQSRASMPLDLVIAGPAWACRIV